MRPLSTRFRKLVLLCLAFSIIPFTIPSHAAVGMQVNESVLKALRWRTIGPAIMGGRVDAFAVVESNPRIIYVGSAGGGVWKTVNNGTTWEPVFDHEGMISIGDVAVSQSNPDIVWVGTGENNNRQSSSWGDGVYKSTDGGKTWKNMGLKDTHHIGHVVIDPKDPNIVYVAAMGHLWGPNKERGLFKTTDGGQTWTNIKYIDENTGFTELVMDPSDNNTLYAASYQRLRKVYNYNGGGPGSAIYKTTDAGKTWTKLTNGLPTNEMGRVGMDISRSNPNIVYALVEYKENTTPRPEAAGGRRGGGADISMDGGVFRSDDKGATWKKMGNNDYRPMYFSLIRVDPSNPDRLFFGGLNITMSTDAGRTARNVGNGTHSDHHAMWINPKNPDYIIDGNDGGMVMSFDGGTTWNYINNFIAAEPYTVTYDMQDPYNVYIGLQDNYTWGGPAVTHHRVGILNDDWFQLVGGDGMYAVVDPNDPTTIYTDTQDGNIVRYDTKTGERKSIRPPAAKPGEPANRYNWTSPIVISPFDSKEIYLAGNKLWRSFDRGDNWEAISPDLTKQWDRDKMPIMGELPSDKTLSRNDGIASVSNGTAMVESPARAGLLYFGTDDGNVQMSADGGVNWTNITSRFPGLPKNAYVNRIEASRFDANTAYAVFDNHRDDDYNAYVYMTTDQGRTWRSISQGLPQVPARVLREDPYNQNLLFLGTENALYVSTTRGDGWVRLDNGLPNVPVHDIQIHPRDHEMILATHGRGVFIMDIAPLEQMNSDVMAQDFHLFNPTATTEYIPNDHKGFLASNTYVGANRPFGTSIDYYLKNAPSGDVRIAIYNIRGEKLRDIPGTKEAGLNRVQWNLQMNAPPRPNGFGGGFGNFGGGGGEQPGQNEAAGGAPAGGGGGGRGAGGGGRGQGGDRQIESNTIPGNHGGGGESRAGGGGGGGGRFGFGGPVVPPGEYLVKVTVDGKEQTATLTVRPDAEARIDEADRATLTDFVMEAYRLQFRTAPVVSAVSQLESQMSSTMKAINENKELSANVKKSAEALSQKIRELQQKVGQASNQLAQASRAAEQSTSLPSGASRQGLKEATDELTRAVATINDIITKSAPELNDQLDKANAPSTIPRLKPGSPVSLSTSATLQ
ncbi:MAG TPA: glycosyl hydrolase [Blastocatellia bacterium]|nr:glycosyl hydrolase [Blastocatellia bacterium]